MWRSSSSSSARPASGHPLGLNGAPFAGTTDLAHVWLDRQGRARVEPIEPGQPQQNGRHELQVHRAYGRDGQTAGRECGPCSRSRFDRWHPPGLQREQPSPRGAAACLARRLPRPLPLSEVQAGASSLRPGLRNAWTKPWTMPGTPCAGCAPTGPSSGGSRRRPGLHQRRRLKGEPVGIAETDSGDWIVRFAEIDLGIIDRRTKKLHGFRAARPGRAEAKHTRG